MKHVVTAIVTVFGAFLSMVVLLALAENYSLENGKITFAAPEGFRPMSAAAIKIKYPRGRAPKYVIGNASAQTGIAYDLKPYDMPPHKLAEARLAFASILPKLMPGLRWLRRDIIQLSGRKWVLLEMTSKRN